MKEDLESMDLSRMDREPYRGNLAKVTFTTDGFTVGVDLRRYSLDVLKNDHSVYRIDLELCTTTGEVLDKLVQIAKKRWAKPELMGLILLALDKALDLQRNICGCGLNLEMDPSKVAGIVEDNMRKLVGWDLGQTSNGVKITWNPE